MFDTTATGRLMLDDFKDVRVIPLNRTVRAWHGGESHCCDYLLHDIAPLPFRRLLALHAGITCHVARGSVHDAVRAAFSPSSIIEGLWRGQWQAVVRYY